MCPFFFDGNMETRLSPLDGIVLEMGGKVLTVEEHMKERFQSTYGRRRRGRMGSVSAVV